MKNKNIDMRRIFLLLAATLSVQFAGCNGETAKESENSNASPTEKVLAVNNHLEPKDENKEKSTILLSKQDFLDKVWNFEENSKEWVYKGDKPCLIDFYADWCGPCRMMAPVMEELAKEYEGEIYIYKIDTEDEKQLSAAMGIQSLPTFLIIPMGEQPQMLSGARSKEFFKEVIDNHLIKDKSL